MLRRKPTALTISPEDLTAFEQIHNYNKALQTYKKTGLDPEGYFSNENTNHPQDQRPNHQNANPHATTSQQQQQQQVDPNDELKPLPGDKARIVRSREERIIGSSTLSNSTSGARQQQQQQHGGSASATGTATGTNAGPGTTGFARR